MRPELVRLAGELTARGEPYVLAVVVRRRPPSSAQVGDAAVVTAAGELRGWLGGSCTEPTVLGEARRALADGRPRLLALEPDPAEAAGRPGVTVLPMTCHSGGSVEIYLEPVLPAPRLLLFGVSPLVRALARLGAAAGYAVAVADPAAEEGTVPEAERTFTDLGALGSSGASGTSRADDAIDWTAPAGRLAAVVATLGRHDEEAAAAALALAPGYLGVVASPKRAGEIRRALLDRGAAAEAVAAIRSPAGLDLGARTPEEIAVSILAEIVQVRRAAEAAGAAAGEPAATVAAARAAPAPAIAGGEARDPVCGMTVAVKAATPHAELAGRTWYFCCGSCRERFVSDPDLYVLAAQAEEAGG